MRKKAKTAGMPRNVKLRLRSSILESYGGVAVFEAMRAICGLPNTVVTLPILADVAMPKSIESISYLGRFCLSHSLSINGVRITQAASLVKIADRMKAPKFTRQM